MGLQAREGMVIAYDFFYISCRDTFGATTFQGVPFCSTDQFFNINVPNSILLPENVVIQFAEATTMWTAFPLQQRMSYLVVNNGRGLRVPIRVPISDSTNHIKRGRQPLVLVIWLIHLRPRTPGEPAPTPEPTARSYVAIYAGRC
jgi:hypothetical protein